MSYTMSSVKPNPKKPIITNGAAAQNTKVTIPSANTVNKLTKPRKITTVLMMAPTIRDIIPMII